LNVSQGAVTGHASVGGTITGLAGGATGTSIVVGLGGTTNTATAGAKAGTVSLGFASDGTGVGSSGYAPTTLASQTIAVDGQVNQYAKPTYTQASGDGTLAGSGTSYTFNLGTFDHGSGTYTGLISLNNVLVDPQYQDLLNGTFTLTGQMDKFILSGLDNLTDIGIGLNHTLSIGFDSGSQPDGTYIGHILFNPMSVNGDTPEALSQIDMTVEFQVVPEPATWGMVLSGFGMLIGIQRLRRNRVGTR